MGRRSASIPLLITRVLRSFSVFLGLMYPALTKLFPTFIEELRIAGGAVAPPQPVVYRGGGVVQVPTSSSEWDIRQLYISREVLEALLRKMVLRDHPNVKSIYANVTDLKGSPGTVDTAVLRKADGSSEDLQGTVFIDATGTANGSKQNVVLLQSRWDLANLNPCSRHRLVAKVGLC